MDQETVIDHMTFHAHKMHDVILEAINDYLKDVDVEIKKDTDVLGMMLLGIIGAAGKIMAMSDRKEKYQKEITHISAEAFNKFQEIRMKIHKDETQH